MTEQSLLVALAELKKRDNTTIVKRVWDGVKASDY